MKVESPSISTGLGLFRLPAGLYMGFACALLASCGGGDVSEDLQEYAQKLVDNVVGASFGDAGIVIFRKSV